MLFLYFFVFDIRGIAKQLGFIDKTKEEVCFQQVSQNKCNII